MRSEKLASSPWMMLTWLGPSVVIALAERLFPQSELNSTLIYDRNAILQGELWRMWTCHFLHFNVSHLWINVLTGWILIFSLKQATCAEVTLVFILAPATIAVFLLFMAPEMTYYAGFSGLASSLVVWIVVERLNVSLRDVWAWTLLTGFSGKILWECFSGEPSFLQVERLEVQVATMAHIGGAATMVMLWAFKRDARTSRWGHFLRATTNALNIK